MVGSIYFIQMPYSDFSEFKGRPVLVFQKIDKNDVLILPLTTNLDREGVSIGQQDILEGTLKKESVIIIPKITAIDIALIDNSHKIATLKKRSFTKVAKQICEKLSC
ncbi:MAG: hypothetical protein L3J47_11870 [Sulfurovum sp.]|nr:hypothetical protein [Sulfurovum sp.]